MLTSDWSDLKRVKLGEMLLLRYVRCEICLCAAFQTRLTVKRRLHVDRTEPQGKGLDTSPVIVVTQLSYRGSRTAASQNSLHQAHNRNSAELFHM